MSGPGDISDGTVTVYWGGVGWDPRDSPEMHVHGQSASSPDPKVVPASFPFDGEACLPPAEVCPRVESQVWHAGKFPGRDPGT